MIIRLCKSKMGERWLRGEGGSEDCAIRETRLEYIIKIKRFREYNFIASAIINSLIPSNPDKRNTTPQL